MEGPWLVVVDLALPRLGPVFHLVGPWVRRQAFKGLDLDIRPACLLEPTKIDICGTEAGPDFAKGVGKGLNIIRAALEGTRISDILACERKDGLFDGSLESRM